MCNCEHEMAGESINIIFLWAVKTNYGKNVKAFTLCTAITKDQSTKQNTGILNTHTDKMHISKNNKSLYSKDNMGD
jgi:hypothetical protein